MRLRIELEKQVSRRFAFQAWKSTFDENFVFFICHLNSLSGYWATLWEWDYKLKIFDFEFCHIPNYYWMSYNMFYINFYSLFVIKLHLLISNLKRFLKSFELCGDERWNQASTKYWFLFRSFIIFHWHIVRIHSTMIWGRKDDQFSPLKAWK